MNFIRPALLAILLSCASMALAAPVTQQMYVTGTIYAAIPCVINKNAPIRAPFGDVQTAGIDGSYKTITLDYELDCSRSTSNELRIQVRGNPGIDFSLLAIPGYNNLSIALKKDGVPLALNTWVDFNTSKKPLLQAVLVKRENSEVLAGSFSSSATLVVDYR